MKSDGRIPAAILDAAVELLGQAGRIGTVRVQGESMRPTLPPGSVVAVEFTAGPFGRGDLLLFRQGDYLVVHRLLGWGRLPDGSRFLRTRGDGVLALDAPVAPARAIGRVVAVRQEDLWRGFQGRAARVYARAIAAHDFAWAALGLISDRTVDRLLRRRGSDRSIRWRVAALDRRLLRGAHRRLFDRLHPPVPPPPGEAPVGEANASPLLY